MAVFLSGMVMIQIIRPLSSLVNSLCPCPFSGKDRPELRNSLSGYPCFPQYPFYFFPSPCRDSKAALAMRTALFARTPIPLINQFTDQPVPAAKLLIAAPQPAVRQLVSSEKAAFSRSSQSWLFGCPLRCPPSCNIPSSYALHDRS